MGLASLAVTSDGDVIANPRFLRTEERRLRPAQRGLSRRQKGSANRAGRGTGSRCCTVRCGKPGWISAQGGAWLVRDNQAVYAEDLAVNGLARTRLARSVANAGWSQLLRLHGGKSSPVRPHVH